MTDDSKLRPAAPSCLGEYKAWSPERLEQQNAENAVDATALRALRPEVLAFAAVMEWTLKNNDDKGGWKDCNPFWLLGRLADELSELTAVLGDQKTAASEIRFETADIANFAMMIADTAGELLQDERAQAILALRDALCLSCEEAREQQGAGEEVI